MAGQDEDRHAIVVVAAPAASGLERAAAGDNRPSRHELIDDLAIDAPGTAWNTILDGLGTGKDPLVEAVTAVTEPVARSGVGPGDETIEGHGHGENACGHGVSPSSPPLGVAVARSAGRGSAGWPGQNRRDVLEQLDSTIEGAAAHHVEGDVRVPV